MRGGQVGLVNDRLLQVADRRFIFPCAQSQGQVVAGFGVVGPQGDGVPKQASASPPFPKSVRTLPRLK